MATLVHLHLGTFVDITVERFIRIVSTVCHLIAYQLIIDALSIRTCELSRFACTIRLFRTSHLVRLIPTVVLAIAPIHITNTLEVLAGKLSGGASLVFVIAELALVGSVTTIVVVVTQPSLRWNTFYKTTVYDLG